MLAVYNCMFWVYLGLSGLNSLFYTDWTTLVKQTCHKAIHLTKQLRFACDHVMHGKSLKPVKANRSRPICIHTEVILKARQSYYGWQANINGIWRDQRSKLVLTQQHTVIPTRKDHSNRIFTSLYNYFPSAF